MLMQRKFAAGLFLGMLGAAVGLTLWHAAPRAQAQQPGQPVPDPEITWIGSWTKQWWKLRKADEETYTDQTTKVGVEIMYDNLAGTVIYASPEPSTIAAAPMQPFFAIRAMKSGDAYVVYKFASRTGETWEWIKGSQWSKVADPHPGKSALYEMVLTQLPDGGVSALRINQVNGITWTLSTSADGGSRWVRLTEPQ